MSPTEYVEMRARHGDGSPMTRWDVGKMVAGWRDSAKDQADPNFTRAVLDILHALVLKS